SWGCLALRSHGSGLHGGCSGRFGSVEEAGCTDYRRPGRGGKPRPSLREQGRRASPLASGPRRRLNERIGELVEGERVRALHEDGVASAENSPQEHEGLATIGDLVCVAKARG